MEANRRAQIYYNKGTQTVNKEVNRVAAEFYLIDIGHTLGYTTKQFPRYYLTLVKDIDRNFEYLNGKIDSKIQVVEAFSDGFNFLIVED